MNKRIFLLQLVFVILFCIISNASYGAKQRVYIAKDPVPGHFNFFQYVNYLKSKEKQWDNNRIVEELISRGWLIDITENPVEQQKLGIKEWSFESKKFMQLKKQCNHSIEVASRLFIYKFDTAGYGLFTIDKIKKGYIIGEYSGNTRHGLEEEVKDRSYLVAIRNPRNNGHISIDAKDVGTPAKFALHLPESLSDYKFFPGKDGKITKVDDVMMANAYLNYEHLSQQGSRKYKKRTHKTKDGILLLIAYKDILPFTQIGYNYGDYYEWSNGPFLFSNVNGEIISEEIYCFSKKIRLQEMPQRIISNVLDEENALLLFNLIRTEGKETRIQDDRSAVSYQIQLDNEEKDVECVFYTEDLRKLENYLSEKNNRNKHAFFLPFHRKDTLREKDNTKILNENEKIDDNSDKRDESNESGSGGAKSNDHNTHTTSLSDNKSLRGLDNIEKRTSTFIPKAWSISFGSNFLVANNNNETFLKYRKQLSEILNSLYDCSGADCNETKGRIETMLRELSSNQELSSEQKEELIAVTKMVNHILSAKQGVRYHDYSYILNGKNEHFLGLSNEDANSTENMFKLDIKFPPSSFNPLREVDMEFQQPLLNRLIAGDVASY